MTRNMKRNYFVLQVFMIAMMALFICPTVWAVVISINQNHEEEPNNSRGQANQLNDNSGILGCMFDTSTDNDYYYFTTDKTNQLITVEAVGGFVVDTYLVIQNSSGSTLAFDDDSGPGLNAKITGCSLPTIGTYYIWVYEATAGYGAGFTYTLTGTVSETSAIENWELY